MQVTNKDIISVLYLKKGSWFMSLTQSEVYDLAANLDKILGRMEECRSVALGQAIFSPTCPEDEQMTMKTSKKRKQLDKEENAMHYQQQPSIVETVPSANHSSIRRHTKRKQKKAPPPEEDEGDEDEDDLYDPEEGDEEDR